jgi:3-hexulose-6-phosphate synthase
MTSRKKILLQLALDCLSLADARRILQKAGSFFDILEVGTPLLKAGGLDAVRAVRADFPDRMVLADTKTMDAGAVEAAMVFGAGAHIMTVCAAAPDATIRSVLKAAAEYGARAAVDFIGVSGKRRRLAQIRRMDPHFICGHLGIDEQGEGRRAFFDEAFAPAPDRPDLMLAGGIRPETIREILPLRPDVIIVGGYVTGAESPALAARRIRNELTRLTS